MVQPTKLSRTSGLVAGEQDDFDRAQALPTTVPVKAKKKNKRKKK